VIFVFLFISCQTIPKVPDVFLEDSKFAPLDAGASIYLFANVKEVRSIIELLPIQELNDKQVRQMINRTNFAAVAFFPEESGRRFQLAAWGNYPGAANTALSSNKNWKKQRSPAKYKYWHSSADKLSLVITSKQAFINASLNKEPLDPVTSMPGAEIPEGFNNFRRKGEQTAPLACWVENPAPAIFQTLNDAGIPVRFPVQKLFFKLLPAGDKYDAIIRLQFENASMARGMSAVLTLASGFVSNDPNMLIAALFLANPPVQDGSSIEIKTAPLTGKEISLLLQMFSIY